MTQYFHTHGCPHSHERFLFNNSPLQNLKVINRGSAEEFNRRLTPINADFTSLALLRFCG
jgi:hypothetical protein